MKITKVFKGRIDREQNWTKWEWERDWELCRNGELQKRRVSGKLLKPVWQSGLEQCTFWGLVACIFSSKISAWKQRLPLGTQLGAHESQARVWSSIFRVWASPLSQLFTDKRAENTKEIREACDMEFSGLYNGPKNVHILISRSSECFFTRQKRPYRCD